MLWCSRFKPLPLLPELQDRTKQGMAELVDYGVAEFSDDIPCTGALDLVNGHKKGQIYGFVQIAAM